MQITTNILIYIIIKAKRFKFTEYDCMRYHLLHNTAVANYDPRAKSVP